MHSAGTGCTAGKNLTALGSELVELCNILIINECALFNTELADFSASVLSLVVLIKSQGCNLL